MYSFREKEKVDLVEKFELGKTDKIIVETEVGWVFEKPYIKKMVVDKSVIKRFLDGLRNSENLHDFIKTWTHYQVTLYSNNQKIFTFTVNNNMKFIGVGYDIGSHLYTDEEFYKVLDEVIDNDKWDAVLDENLTFAIFTDKNEYQLDELIELKAELKNIGIEDVKILIDKKSFYNKDELRVGGVKLKIINPQNKEIGEGFLGEISNENFKWFSLNLKPSESFSSVIGDLREYCKEKGTYKIQAYYYLHPTEEGVKGSWQGTLPSNEIEITIK